MLLETLKHELELDDLPEALARRGLPIDAIWSGFAVQDSFFVAERGAEEFPRSQKRAILATLVAAHEDGEQAEADALSEIPSQVPEGWIFVTKPWDIVKGFAFLEYYFVYAFNDFKQYGRWPFANEHEGDIEGCCVVFERRFLERLAAGTDEAEEVVPHTVITVAHEGSQEIDSIQRLPIVRDRARDDLKVYVAVGSHGTYLTAGSHDILDFEDVVTDIPLKLPTWVIVAGTVTGPALLPQLAVLLGVFEHFVDAEDKTSDNGASIGPEQPDPDPASLEFDKRIEVTPLSDIQDRDGVNIYQDTPALREALAVRGFPGTWGGYAGFIDKSPPWENKTARSGVSCDLRTQPPRVGSTELLAGSGSRHRLRGARRRPMSPRQSAALRRRLAYHFAAPWVTSASQSARPNDRRLSGLQCLSPRPAPNRNARRHRHGASQSRSRRSERERRAGR